MISAPPRFPRPRLRQALGAYPGTARAVFACKANVTVAVLREVFGEGLGADVASEGELAAALAAGANPETVIVHGNNKSDADLGAAVEAGCGLVVVDHPGELDQLDGIAAEYDVVQRVLVRVTPGIEADTHRKIVTGHSDSKFGFAPADALDVLDSIETFANLSAAGLHVHLGSQIRDLRTYVDAIGWLANLIDENGLGELSVLDLGGGLRRGPHRIGRGTPDRYCVGRSSAAVDRGSWPLAACRARTRARAGALDRGPRRRDAVLGGGDQTGADRHGVRGGRRRHVRQSPADAVCGRVPGVVVADRADAPAALTYTIAGKHCETGDVLIEAAALPRLASGDVLAVPATGAYTASMASNYNAVPRPAAVMVAGGEARLIGASRDGHRPARTRGRCFSVSGARRPTTWPRRSPGRP